MGERMTDLVCRKCGVGLHECGGYLTRVNEKGVSGIWECRPVCGADMPRDTALIMAIEYADVDANPTEEIEQ